MDDLSFIQDRDPGDESEHELARIDAAERQLRAGFAAAREDVRRRQAQAQSDSAAGFRHVPGYAMVDVQADEYGSGRAAPANLHAFRL